MPKFNDLTGQIFGDYEVISRAEDRVQPSGKHEVQWNLKCINCGNEVVRAARNLKVCTQNRCPECVKKERDLTGKQYGHWLVLEMKPKDPKEPRQWLCKCTRCGKTTKYVYEDNLLRNHSSGCLKCLHITHGDASGSRLYEIWHGMKSRTKNKTNTAYKNYGAKGIKVCKEWTNDYQKFKEWALNNGYDDNLTIDRIDPDGNYEPSNCRWISQTAQNGRLRRNYSTGYIGVTFVERKGGDTFYQPSIRNSKRAIYLGKYKTAIEAAFARDLYLLENNLLHEHNGNFITLEKLQFKEIKQ